MLIKGLLHNKKIPISTSSKYMQQKLTVEGENISILIIENTQGRPIKHSKKTNKYCVCSSGVSGTFSTTVLYLGKLKRCHTKHPI